jgi:hypothetical protein
MGIGRLATPYRHMRPTKARNDSRVSSMVPIRAALGSCIVLLNLAGCGSKEPSLGKIVPVEGKITLANGTPVPGGHVSFVPLDRDPNLPGATSEGRITPEGAYKVFTNNKPGAPLGKYRVVLSRGSDRRGWSRVPKRYFDEVKSPLEVEVVEDKPEGGYDFKIQTR